MTLGGDVQRGRVRARLLLFPAHYLDRGYVHAKVGNPRARAVARQAVDVHHDPDRRGPAYTLGTVDVTGDLLGATRVLPAARAVKPGEIFNRSELAEDLQKLTDYYKDRGYAYVNVTPLTPIDEKTRTVNVTFEIQKGPAGHLRPHQHPRQHQDPRQGHPARDAHLRGRNYNQTQLDYSKRRVTALGFFEKVDVSTKRGDGDDKIDVNVEVTERPTGTFQIGAGFSSVENFIAQAQISQNNLLGRGQLLTLQAQLSSLRQLFLLRFQDPYFLDTKWTFGFNLFNRTSSCSRSSVRRRAAALTWGYLLAEDTRLLLTYTLEDVSVSTGGFTGLFSSAALQPTPIGSIAEPAALRNDVLGARVALLRHARQPHVPDARLVQHAVGRDRRHVPAVRERFTRYEAVARAFYPVWGPFVLRLKANAGLIASRDPRGVPIFERYFVGGIYDVRGFPPRSLGPGIRALADRSQDSSLRNFLVGGNMNVIMNAEIEFPIFDKVGIRGRRVHRHGQRVQPGRPVLRIKPSNVDDSKNPCLGPLNFSAYRQSWGFGFRWFSPIGPLRFEWGVPFKTLPGEQPIVFEFTIGNFF